MAASPAESANEYWLASISNIVICFRLSRGGRSPLGGRVRLLMDLVGTLASRPHFRLRRHT